MTEKHTPGPWVWHENGNLQTVKPEVDWLGEEFYPSIVRTDSGHYPPFGADRALIAAAPELLAFVQKLLGEKVGFDGNDLQQEAIALVEKATGSAA